MRLRQARSKARVGWRRRDRPCEGCTPRRSNRRAAARPAPRPSARTARDRPAPIAGMGGAAGCGDPKPSARADRWPCPGFGPRREAGKSGPFPASAPDRFRVHGRSARPLPYRTRRATALDRGVRPDRARRRGRVGIPAGVRCRPFLALWRQPIRSALGHRPFGTWPRRRRAPLASCRVAGHRGSAPFGPGRPTRSARPRRSGIRDRGSVGPARGDRDERP